MLLSHSRAWHIHPSQKLKPARLSNASLRVNDVSAKALSFTEAHVKAAFDHAQKLIQAKNPQEFLAHQSEYVKAQLAAMEEHAKELGTAILKKVTPEK
jgi:phasin family protein